MSPRRSRPTICWADDLYHHHGGAVPLFEALLIRDGKEQLIAVGIVDLDHVITPPRFLARNQALDDFMAKICNPFWVQCDEQSRPVSANGVLAEDHLASRPPNLTSLPTTSPF